MTRKRLKLFGSVVISAMLSESRIFTVAEFPDWSRLFWLAWLYVPRLFAAPGQVRRLLARALTSEMERLRTDWLAGCEYIAAGLLSGVGHFVPVGVAAG